MAVGREGKHIKKHGLWAWGCWVLPVGEYLPGAHLSVSMCTTEFADAVMIPLQQFESLWDAMYRMHTSMIRKATHSYMCLR